MEQQRKLDLKALGRKIFGARKLYIKVCGLVVVLAAIWIFPQPRFYKSTVSLAPESNDASPAGAMSSLASSFGFNLGGLTSSDAFYPLLYPEVVESPDFIVGLFDVQVQTHDGKLNTTYYDYIAKHQKVSLWSIPIITVRRWYKRTFPTAEHAMGKKAGNERPNPFWLSRDDDGIRQTMMANIQCSVDKKTEVISITVIDQDRLVCATMADSVRMHLQHFMTSYRTSKSRNDVEYYEQLVKESRADYETASAAYAAYSDSHHNSILTSVSEEISKLENDLQAKYSAYSAFQTQLQASRAKVQETTPAFTVLKRATVPIRPAGPKRVLFILGMTILAFIGTTAYILRREILGEY